MGKNWKLHHVGVAVEDIDKTIEYFQSLGIATFQPEFTIDNRTITDFKQYGKPVDAKTKIKIRMVQVGSVTLELLQPVEGESLQKEFLSSKGEGVDHIAFTVNDLNKETAKLVEKGIPVILSGKYPPMASSFAYFDTRKVGNVIIELMQ